MSNFTIPLLNAQQQGMAPYATAALVKGEVLSQTTQTLSYQRLQEESEQLGKVIENQAANTVNDEKEGEADTPTPQQQTKREPQEDVETAPSYHNPLAGNLLNEKV